MSGILPPLNIVSITFNLNGGTGVLFHSEIVKKNSTYKIPTTVPTKTGNTFVSWKDQSGKIYKSGSNYPVGTVDVTLTAQWSAVQYTITYNKGIGTGTVPTQENLRTGDRFIVENPTQLKPPSNRYKFFKWLDQSGSYYAPGQEYVVGSRNVILTAAFLPLAPIG